MEIFAWTTDIAHPSHIGQAKEGATKMRYPFRKQSARIVCCSRVLAKKKKKKKKKVFDATGLLLLPKIKTAALECQHNTTKIKKNLFDFRRINIYFLFCRTNSVRDLIFV
jgi:hypothetical protein